MKRIVILGAGGSPADNVIKSLRAAPERFWIIGTEVDPYTIQRSHADETYMTPFWDHPKSIDRLKEIIRLTNAEFVHAQPDFEVFNISKYRDELGILTFLPDHKTVEVCMDKYKSYDYWRNAGLTVPETMLIRNEDDLKNSFQRFGNKIWIRDTTGAAGKGALPTDSCEFAKAWINYRSAWGRCTAAELLTPRSTTFSSLWKSGELVVAQSRERLYWELGNRAPSGVTGITGAGVTVDDEQVTKTAIDAIHAIDNKPNGIFSVDLTYDKKGKVNPTEINIGRFFTTIEFFTRAGLNLPYIMVKLAYGESVPTFKKKINPLTSGLYWIRGMDFLPVLCSEKDIEIRKKEAKRWAK